MRTKNPSLRDIDTRLLRLFCVVVESGGYSSAQTALNLATNTISTHMSNLEARLGFTLCRRGRGGFALTDQGRQAYEVTKRFLSSVDNFNAEIERLQGKMEGEIIIGVVDNVITNKDCRLHQALELITVHAPDVKIAIQVLSPNDVEHWLTSSKLHIAILPKRSIAAEIQMDYLFSEYHALYCGAKHPLFSVDDASITPSVIERQRYVKRGFASALAAYSSLFKEPASATACHMEGLAYFILSGHFVGFLPDTYANQWVEQGEMRPVRIDLHYSEVSICMAYSRENRQNLPTELAIKTILQVHRRRGDLINPTQS